MTSRRVHNVKSPEQAIEALSYFNQFHDGFLESMRVHVTPEGAEGFGFGLPVRHDVTLRFVHSNYPAAEAAQCCSQRIEMRLTQVKRMSVGDMIAVDNMLQECRIEFDADGVIRLDVGGDGLITFSCVALTIKELEDSE